MRKNRKALLLSLLLGLTLATAFTTASCGKDDKPSTSVSDSMEEEENTVYLRMALPYVDVEQYDSLALDYTVRGTTEKVQFTSSDESVAKVDENGVVTTFGVLGKAVITAKVEDLTSTCEVTVTKSPYAPEIVLNATKYSIEDGETLTFSVEAEWNKQTLDEEITYAVSFAEDSQAAKATIGVDGNIVSIKGNGVESVNVIVSATIRGIYTSKMFTVDVKASKLKIQPTSEAFAPSSGMYLAQIAATDKVPCDIANSYALDFVAAKGTEKYESATIDWTVEGDAVTLVDGSVVGAKKGTATLVGTVTVGGETATVKVLCEVIPPEVELTQTATFEIATINNTTLMLEEEIVGKIESAELQGNVVSNRVRGKSMNFLADAFPKSAKDLGAQQLIINTDLVRYTMNVEVYTMVINDADELDLMRTVANTGKTEWSNRFQEERNSQLFDGYFVLGNDISYNREIMSMTDTGSVWTVQGTETEHFRGFIGVFDGKGYNIDGVTVGKHPSGDDKQSGGIFGYVGTGGIVRNVSFTNAVTLANNGFICSMGDGLIENVSISFARLGGDKVSQGLTEGNPRTMGAFFTRASTLNATVRNCLIDASAAEIYLEEAKKNGKSSYNIKLAGTAPTMENVIAICPHEIVLSMSGATVKKANYSEILSTANLMNNFDPTVWTTVEGIPMFVKQAESLDRNKEVKFLGLEENLIAGFEMVVLANNPYVSIEIVEPVAGVALVNGKLTATEEAYTKTVTLKATSLLNPEIFDTFEVYIDSFGNAVKKPIEDDEVPVVYNTNPVLVLGDNSWLGEENYVYSGSEIVGQGSTAITIDFSKCAWGTENYTVVSVKEGVREHFNIDLKLWYTSNAFADSEIVSDSVFDSRRQNSEYSFTDGEVDISAPEGYEKVERIDCTKDWSTALAREFFSLTDLSEYKDIWFGIKLVNAKFVFITKSEPATSWAFFHFTRVGENEWVAEVTIDGVNVVLEFGISGMTLQKMLYRDGWSNGLLIYNNQGLRPEGGTTSLYCTEIRGVK